MAHSNHYKFQGCVVQYSTFPGYVGMLEKCPLHGAREAFWHWFKTMEQAEAFCMRKVDEIRKI